MFVGLANLIIALRWPLVIMLIVLPFVFAGNPDMHDLARGWINSYVKWETIYVH